MYLIIKKSNIIETQNKTQIPCKIYMIMFCICILIQRIVFVSQFVLNYVSIILFKQKKNSNIFLKKFRDFGMVVTMGHHMSLRSLHPWNPWWGGEWGDLLITWKSSSSLSKKTWRCSIGHQRQSFYMLFWHIIASKQKVI